MGNSKNSCPYCDRNLSEIKIFLRGKSRTGFKGFCNECNLPFERFSIKRVSTGWYSTKVAKKDLSNKVVEREILRITEVLSIYEFATKKWIELLQIRKVDDELSFYFSDETKSKGVCIVRNGEPVLNIEISNYLFSKIKNGDEPIYRNA